ncbi:MAG: FAD-binding protein [Desulfurococcales archaeon]|jgi:electron transfer flavoprotein alpha subunit
MKVLAVATGKYSSRRTQELLSASFAISSDVFLAVFDSEISGKASFSVESPGDLKEGWVLESEPLVSPYDIKEVVKELATKNGINAFLFNDSPLSFWIASVLAGELRIPIVTDVLRLYREGDRILATKPINMESVWGEYSVPSDGFVFVIRRGFIGKRKNAKEVVLSRLKIKRSDGQVTVLNESKKEESRLEDALMVIGIGDGVRQSGTLEAAIKLAKLLGAEYGCTKPLVEAGIMNRERMIGLSGKRISPKVYLALGISGSNYHLAGISSSEVIISINIDKGSPMNRQADFFLVGDLKDVLPKLLEIIGSEHKADLFSAPND